MEVILRQDVDKVGRKGGVANVSDGYARNFLLPQKLAEVATASRIAAVRTAQEERDARERREAAQAEDSRDMLSKTVLTIPAPVGSGDRLFGSITSQDIATAIFQARKVRIDKRNVHLEDAIKAVGTYMVKVDVHASVEPAEVKVIVVPEEKK
ncbi:MAG TPA: 50S ribosomal protein L9 [Thermoleophilia bacterium]|nr:50S ribosomal protein L9 [Thermoleophilia bacterium]